MKKNSKRISMCAALLGITALLLCGCSEKNLYKDENMTAVVLDNGDGTGDLSVRFAVLPEEFPEKTKTAVTAGNPVREYEIRLSDGTVYTYSDETADAGGGVCVQVYASREEIEENLGIDLLSGKAAAYPAKENNYVLYFSPAEESISIESAWAKLSNQVSVQERIYMNFSGKDSQYLTGLPAVSENVKYEICELPDGQNAVVFADEATGQACVCVSEGGIVYHWSLMGQPIMETAKQFADTLE